MTTFVLKSIRKTRAIAFYELQGHNKVSTVYFVMETNTDENIVMTRKLV